MNEYKISFDGREWELELKILPATTMQIITSVVFTGAFPAAIQGKWMLSESFSDGTVRLRRLLISPTRPEYAAAMKNTIPLGSQVKDRVTGFKGIAIAHVKYLNGCEQFCVKPAVDKKTNKIEDGIYIDAEQLEVVGIGVAVAPKDTGGPSADAPRGSYRG